MADAEALRLRSLQAAQKAEQARATAAMQANASGQSGGPDEVAALHDAPIVERAAAKYQQDIPLTNEDVAGAVIPEVSENLQWMVKAQTAMKKFTAKHAQLTDEITGLLNVAALAAQRAQGMASAAGNDSGPIGANQKTAQGAKNSNIAIASAKGAADDGSSGSTTNKENATAATGANKTLQALANMKPVSSTSLRDRLKKKLALTKAAEDAKTAALKSANGKDMFEGNLATAGAGAATDSTKGAGTSLAAQAVDSALHSSNTAEQQRFTLAGPETEAAVQKLLRSPSSSGSEFAANDASVLAADSLSLFERVREAHTHCLKNHCVKAN